MSQDYTYNLEDINDSSPTHGVNISPGYFQGQITLHYFGHQSWGGCTERVGYLNDLYLDLLDAGINNVKIIVIGKSEYENSNENWTNENSLPVLIDTYPYNIWSTWGAFQRALYFLDGEGNYITHFSITPWNYGGNIHSNDLVYTQINTIIENNENALNINSHPVRISLLSAHPNPFNPSTNIIFSIPQSNNSKISVYDMGGRFLETLYQSYSTPGNYTLTWDASDYSSGIYFIRLELDNYLISKKLVLAK